MNAMTGTILPPNSSRFERAIEASMAAALDIDFPLRHLWNPASCPADLLPWLAWGVSIDFWNPDWTEAEKRAAIAGAIEQQRRKGTRASLRAVLDRFDPMIEIVEWYQDRVNMAPHTFRLELPLAVETSAEYDEDLIAALLRDIAAVKPLRSHMFAVHRLRAQADLGLLSAANTAGAARLNMIADRDSAQDPAWATYLQTEDGEPLQDEDGEYLVAA